MTGSTLRALTWTGNAGSAWNAAGNWWDATSGGLASVAPGSLDTVSIIGGVGPLVVTGSGAASWVGTHRAVLLDGVFQFGSLDVEGTLALQGLGSRLAVGALGEAAAAVASNIVVTATTLSVAGGAVLGSATVTGGGVLSVGSTLSVSAGLTTDASSCIAMGAGVALWGGWLKQAAGATLSGTGLIASNADIGGVALSSGLRFGGFLGGYGEVRLDASGATVGTVAQGTHLRFAAAGACLTVTGPAASMGGTLLGWAAGDAIDLLGQSVASAQFVATGGQGGVLVLSDAGGHAVAQLNVAGDAGALAASTFLAAADGSGGTMVIDIAPVVAAPVSAGNVTAHRDSWNGTAGAWNLAGNWWDATSGGVASVAPGSLDTVSIIGGVSPLVVTGSGAASWVGTHRAVLLDGVFQFGSLDVEGTLALQGLGSRLAVGALGEAAAAVASNIVVTATTLSVAGGAVLGSATVTGGGVLSVGSTLSVSAGLTTDASSCIAMGAGVALWGGWLKQAAGATLSGTGLIASNADIGGVALSSGLRFGGFLGGYGEVRLDASGATVGTVAQGTHLRFAAAGACLTVTGPAASMGGTLLGWAAGDAIDLLGQSVASAQFVATGGQGGVLVLSDAGGHAVAQLNVAGDAGALAASTFLAAADGSGGTMVIDIAPVVAAPVSAGNVTAHRDSWNGTAGAWNLAGNWWDATSGGVASVAPGSLDTVSIIGGVSPLVVTGSGAASWVGTHRAVLLDGVFQFGSLDVEGTLALQGLGSRLAVGALGEAAAAVASNIVVTATTLSVAGGAVLGSATVTGGGVLSVGSTLSVSAGLTTDASSCIAMGAGVALWGGWLKQAAGATLSGTGLIASNADIGGVALSSGLRFGGFLGGYGEVRLDASGATVGTVAQGTHLRFAAAGACLTVTGPAASMGGTLLGWAAGDAIDLLGQAIASATFSPLDALDGQLALADPAGVVIARLTVAGDAAAYGRASFAALSDGMGGTLITEITASAAVAPLMHPS